MYPDSVKIIIPVNITYSYPPIQNVAQMLGN